MADDSATADDRAQQADALLKNIQQQQKAQLKIFLGAAPGVGKTFSMLNAAKEQRQQGIDVVIGLVETHQRADTAALLTDFEMLPRKQIQYQQQTLSEFDLDAALKRQPELILVDELAHTNVSGSRHKRRYQDIEELLAAGIDVYTTLNVQHLENLHDLVMQITGIDVRETVPQDFVYAAQEVVFIDLPPANLIERLQQGKVYAEEYAQSALENFFTVENISALRELALKVAIEQMASQVKSEQDARTKRFQYAIHDKLLVLISNRSNHYYLIRNARRIIEKRQIPWLVVWVDTGQTTNEQHKNYLQSAMSLAKDFGAETEILRGPSTLETIIPFIIKNRINSVLLGSGIRASWRPWRKRIYQKLIESGLPLEVIVYRSPKQASHPISIEEPKLKTFGNLRSHLFGAITVTIATLLAHSLHPWLNQANLILIFVVAVVLMSLRFGLHAAISSALLAFFSFNFFLTEPRYSFIVNQKDDISTLVLLLIIALVCGPAASLIRRQLFLLEESNRYSETLRSLAQTFSVVNSKKNLWRELAKTLANSLRAECHIVTFKSKRHLDYQVYPTAASVFAPIDEAAIEWTRKHRETSGRFTDTLSASQWTFFPICKHKRILAILLLRFNESITGLSPYNKNLIAAMTQQAVDAWQRIRLVNDLESARVTAQVEQLRSALLSSVSHDLRSPLSAMMGAADSLRLLDPQLDLSNRIALIDTIVQESQRLDRYIENLIDMTRINHGDIKIERDWVSISDIIGSALTRIKRYFPHAITEYREEPMMPLLYVNAALLEQVIFNVLENAVKYSPDDEKITLHAACNARTCTIEIEDHGPGIAEPLREKIFDMFYVIADGDQRQHNTGMGLAICRGMIAAHGGTITALAGQNDIGTRFLIQLPLQAELNSRKKHDS